MDIVNKLIARLDENLADFEKHWQTLDKQAVLDMAETITATRKAHDFMTGAYGYDDDEAAFLLKLPNPLEEVAGRWLDHEPDVELIVRDMLNEALHDKELAIEIAATGANRPRYIVHDLENGHPVLIDREEKSIAYYEKNRDGQIYNLENPKVYSIGTQSVKGLVKRHNSPDPKRGDVFDLERHTGIRNAIDSFIYAYLMTPEQQEELSSHKYRFTVTNDLTPLVAATDDYAEAITKMCDWVYDKERAYRNTHGDGMAEHGIALRYCYNYLAQYGAAPNTQAQKDVVTGRKSEKDRPKIPPPKPSILGELEKYFKEVKARPSSVEALKKDPERS